MSWGGVERHRVLVARSHAVRRAEREDGLAFARAWRERLRLCLAGQAEPTGPHMAAFVAQWGGDADA